MDVNVKCTTCEWRECCFLLRGKGNPRVKILCLKVRVSDNYNVCVKIERQI
jgi:hypothetical protein